MREIKFRAWDKKYTKMYHGDIKIALTYPNEEVEIMQYTGLKDKNGKEIYEGDIIQSKKGINAIVSYPENQSGFFIRWRNIYNAKRKSHYFKPLIWAIRRDEFKIIGNIYENPELVDSPLTTEPESHVQ